jgi:hypothetical protein
MAATECGDPIPQYIGLGNITANSDTYFRMVSKSHAAALGIAFSYMWDQKIVFVVIVRLARNRIQDFAGVARATRFTANGGLQCRIVE